MLGSGQYSQISIRRDAWVEIDLGALESNFKIVRSWLADNCHFMAVVKSDAYGHGAEQVATIMQASGADWLAVASVDEGCQLRNSGIHLPILILGPCPNWAMSTAIKNNLCLTITSPLQIEDIVAASSQLGQIAQVQLKIDTGMHRLGVSPKLTVKTIKQIVEKQHLQLVGLFSHLACPGKKEIVEKQNTVFNQTILQLNQKPNLIHLASSEATKLFPETHHDMVRVGLYLYGLESNTESKTLHPAMSLRARINHIEEIEEGESVGYGLTWTARRPSRLASIPIGYGDGVQRLLSNKMSGLLWGKVIKQVGMISMDQMLFDITDIPEAQVGDVITLIGADMSSPNKHIYLSSWANLLNTITYELACNLRVRLPRIYTRNKITSNTN